MLNYFLGGHGPDITWFFVFHKFQCYCGWSTYAVHKMRVDMNPDIPITQKDLPLVHILDSIFDLDSLYLGRRIKGMIGTFINRWNLFADVILVCSPFISSRFTSGMWKWLMKQLSPYKYYIITRPPSFGLRKRKLPLFKALKEKDEKKARFDLAKLVLVDPKKFEENFIAPALTFDQVIRRKKFHAKYYAGIFSDHVEIIQTSFNLFEGEEHQLENVSFHLYPPNFFFSRFIQPFKIEELRAPPDTVLEKQEKIGCAICYEGEDGDFDVKFWHYKTRPWEIINYFINEIKS